jgi:hypothetical protein
VTAVKRLGIRASPVVEGPQAKIRRYLAPDGCKFRPGEAHVSSGESRRIFEFKLNTMKKGQSSAKFDKIYRYFNRIYANDLAYGICDPLLIKVDCQLNKITIAVEFFLQYDAMVQCTSQFSK